MTSPSTSAHFVELTSLEIAQLPAILLQRLPKAAQLYNIVQIRLLNRYEHDLSVFRYTELDLHKTLLAARILTKPKTYWNILAPICCDDALLPGIVSNFVKLVEWDRKLSFNAVDSRIFQHLSNYCGMPEGFSKIAIGGGFYTMSMPTALAMDLSLPEPLSLRKLKENDLKTVFENWSHASYNELDFIALAALHLGSAGLTLDDQLVSFGLNLFDGAIHVVQTLTQYRGRGYANTLMRHLCHSTVATLGQFPVVQIVATNLPSKKLMEGVGFVYSHEVTWTEYLR